MIEAFTPTNDVASGQAITSEGITPIFANKRCRYGRRSRVQEIDEKRVGEVTCLITSDRSTILQRFLQSKEDLVSSSLIFGWSPPLLAVLIMR